MEITIDIKDEKVDEVLDLLRGFDYIKVREPQEETKIEKLFGIWKDRDITLKDLREKAWKKNDSLWYKYFIELFKGNQKTIDKHIFTYNLKDF